MLKCGGQRVDNADDCAALSRTRNQRADTDGQTRTGAHAMQIEGTDISKMDDGGTQFRRYAISNRWGQLIAWLEAQNNAGP